MEDACLVYWCWYERWFDTIRGSKASSLLSFKHYLFNWSSAQITFIINEDTFSTYRLQNSENSCSFPVTSNWYLLILKTSKRGPKYPSHLKVQFVDISKETFKITFTATTICNTWPNSFTLYYFYQEIISFQPVSSIRISLHSSVCFLFEQIVSLNLTFPFCRKRDS